MGDVSIFETEHFIFRIISEDDYDLYYKLMLDEPVVQWVFREDMEEKINKIYDTYSEDDPHETNAMNKAMTWSGIQMRTMTDGSDSKLAELLLQGLNMGIIEGRRLLNNKDEDPKVKDIMKEYVDVQEEYVEKIKNFL